MLIRGFARESSIFFQSQPSTSRNLPFLSLDVLGKRSFSLDVLGNVMTRTELLQGTLDMLILRVLSVEPMHGWGIAQRIHILSKDVLKVEEGSLYPALYRMERKGWIESEWGQSENNRRAKFYRLTKTGQKQLASEVQGWERISAAIAKVMQAP